MLSLDEMKMTEELARRGFKIVVRVTTGADGETRYNLSGQGVLGAFVVSAPTEAEAYLTALNQAQSLDSAWVES